jgi:muconolactone delta-isomerase
LLPRNVAAITLGRRIWIARELPPAEMEVLLRHEMVHVRQMEQLGVPRFLWRYVGEYVRNRLRGMDHDAAYRAISFEREAFAVE